MNENKITHFPIFFEAKKAEVIVFGGGEIATRRVKTLVKFNLSIIVVAPKVSSEIEELANNGELKILNEEYSPTHITNQFIALACTNNREVNHAIGIDAKSKNIPVSVCDKKEECTFFFPSIIETEDVTVAVIGSGKNHKKTKQTADKIRKTIGDTNED